MLMAALHWRWEAAITVLAGDSGLKNLSEFLLNAVEANGDAPQKLRVTISETGELGVTVTNAPVVPLTNLFPSALPPPGLDERGEHVEPESLVPLKKAGFDVVIDTGTTKRSEFTHFKTSRRDMYDRARERAGIQDRTQPKEVLLVNATNGVIMEASLTTPYFWRGGRWVTPPVSLIFNMRDGSGGNNGTSRRWALERLVVSNI
jgi:hypothetical protein